GWPQKGIVPVQPVAVVGGLGDQVIRRGRATGPTDEYLDVSRSGNATGTHGNPGWPRHRLHHARALGQHTRQVIAVWGLVVHPATRGTGREVAARGLRR